MKNKLAGTGVALATPFNEKLQVDYEGLGRLLNHVSQGGVEYLVVLGTTGETATLTAEEKRTVLSFVKKNNTHQLPIVYGLGGNNTGELLEQISQTDWQGIDAVLSVSPYYNKPSQQGIVAHYTAIADACPVPVMLYNVPARTSSNITAATTLKLAAHPNIIGTKEASGDMVQCMEIARHKPQDFLLISGDDLLTLPMMAFGAVGVISVLANAFPGSFSQMVRHGLEGDFDQASKELFSFLQINPLLYEEGNPVGLKQVLHYLEICSPRVRLPLASASEALSSKIKAAMQAEVTLQLSPVK